jgi:ClpP class serine protease
MSTRRRQPLQVVRQGRGSRPAAVDETARREYWARVQALREERTSLRAG